MEWGSASGWLVFCAKAAAHGPGVPSGGAAVSIRAGPDIGAIPAPVDFPRRMPSVLSRLQSPGCPSPG
eukprot:6688829-Pyramimonas_sp.AAC.1